MTILQNMLIVYISSVLEEIWIKKYVFIQYKLSLLNSNKFNKETSFILQSLYLVLFNNYMKCLEVVFFYLVFVINKMLFCLVKFASEKRR